MIDLGATYDVVDAAAMAVALDALQSPRIITFRVADRLDALRSVHD